jgi:hypothetical protein
MIDEVEVKPHPDAYADRLYDTHASLPVEGATSAHARPNSLALVIIAMIKTTSDRSDSLNTEATY